VQISLGKLDISCSPLSGLLARPSFRFLATLALYSFVVSPDNIMTGYDKLARLLADYPNLTIYRRFGVLSAKVLLFMQAELVHLERNLEIVAHDDRKDPARSSFESSWAALFGAPSEEGADLQSRKIIEIQDKLSNYRMRQGNRSGFGQTG
jgi:hypothetical protein